MASAASAPSFTVPFAVNDIATAYGTPTWYYDADLIRKRVEELRSFDTIRYAQKANSNIAILALLRRMGVVVDAVTAGEISRALKAGFSGGEEHPDVVYTADLLDEDAVELIRAHNIPVNIGSPNMIDVLADYKLSVPVTLRINPGFGHGHSHKVNTGGEWSKHGIWHTDVEQVLQNARYCFASMRTNLY